MERIAVIGAGASGIAVTKELKEHGFAVDCFDANSEIGGVYATAYNKCQLTTSTLITPFSDFEDADASIPQVWTVEEYCAYLQRYIDHFSLGEDIRLSTKITRVTRAEEGGYYVTLKPDDGSHKTTYYSHVAVCTGTNRKPKLPEFEAQHQFQGQIIHSSQYTGAASYEGKRVLLIGAGESGSDISLHVSEVAEATAISIRHEHGYIVPRFLLGNPTDIETARSHHSFPIWWGDVYHTYRFYALYMIALIFKLFGSKENKRLAPVMRKWADLQIAQGTNGYTKFGCKNLSLVEAMVYHGCQVKPGISCLDKTGVVFTDGSRFDCDTIICTTGYQNAFPFLEDDFAPYIPDLLNSRRLYKHCVHPKLGHTLFFSGFARPALGALPPISELQARWFTLLILGERELPTTQEMGAVIKADTEKAFRQYGEDSCKISSLVNFLNYMDEIAKLIGCYPQFDDLRQRDKQLWKQIILGPISSSQYRLYGPDAKPDLASRILKQQPAARDSLDIVLLRLFHRLSAHPKLHFFALMATWTREEGGHWCTTPTSVPNES